MMSQHFAPRTARRAGVELLESRTLLAVFTVTSPADSGPGTLRQAILDANATYSVADQIHFNLVGPGIHAISPTSALPAVISAVLIDGTTQPGYAGSPLIELDGSAAGPGADGLMIGRDTSFSNAAGSAVRGLAINGFTGNGITVYDAGVRIEGNHVGLNAAGDAARQNGGAGILVVGVSFTIGGTTQRQRNILSGNAGPGIELRSDPFGDRPSGPVLGNYIGTDATGSRAIPNGREGVLADRGGTLTIGGGAQGAGNVISGNGASGVRLVGTGATIKGNLIGTDAAGARAVPNGQAPAAANRHGITIEPVGSLAGTHNIGGLASGERNVISANHGAGISAVDSTSIRIENNFIGTDLAGAADLGNAGDGITLRGVSGFPGYDINGNVISGNGGDGLRMDRMGPGTIADNYVGVDDTGTRPLGNDGDGMDISNNSSVYVRSASFYRPRNVISANGGHGLRLAGSLGNPGQIERNHIGTDVTGEIPLGNGGSGVYVTGDGWMIGRPSASGNLISANRGDGVTVDGSRGHSVGTIQSNRIGVSLSGDARGMGNGRHGVALLNASRYVVGHHLGTTVSDAGENVIAHNAANGVMVSGEGAAANVITGNAIYSNGGAEIDLGGDGVTPNDPGDTDTGPNGLLNYPLITEAIGAPAGSVPTRTVVRFTLAAVPQRTYWVNFYSAPEADETGHGGATRRLGLVRVTTDSAGNAAGTASVLPVAPGAFVSATASDFDSGTGNTSEFSRAARAAEPEVAGRFVFYNNSPRDGGDPGANAGDDAAIAENKYPMHAPGRSLAENVTSYHKGINGIIIDLPNLPEGAVLTGDDFEFRSGNGSAAGWRTGPAPSSITVRRGAGIGGTDRVTLIWPDYDPRNPNDPDDAVANGYLRVTVKASQDTGLSRPDVFYFGNLVGDTLAGAPFGRTAYRVDARDLSGLVGALGTTNANLIGWYDHNGDGQVTARDFVIARSNLLRALSHDVRAPE
jgi:hypothetical protein